MLQNPADHTEAGEKFLEEMAAKHAMADKMHTFLTFRCSVFQRGYYDPNKME